MAVRVAVVGAGVMGADHARIVAHELPGAVLQVVCDTNEAAARKAADSHGALDVSTDPSATISRKDVDAIIIASPDRTHAALAKECMGTGKKLLCEKPLSQSSRECLGVMAEEQRVGERRVQLGFMRRYDQSYVEMKDALESGAIGPALIMHNFHRNVATPFADFTGSMAISSSAVHEFDIVRHVLGIEFVSIAASQPIRSDDVVAPVVMMLETNADQVVTVEVNNNAAYGYDVRTELVGESGSVASNPVAYSRTEARLASSTRYDPDWRGRFAEAYRRQNQEFLKFVETGVFPMEGASCWDGYCAAAVSEAGVEALAKGRRMPVDMIAKPEFYQ